MKLPCKRRLARRLVLLRGVMLALTIVVLVISFKLLGGITPTDHQVADEAAAWPNTMAMANSRSGTNSQPQSGIRFVLFLGVEGTGHHLWQELIKESPVLQQLKDLGLHPKFTKELTQNLYRHKKSRWNGLWSSTCKWSEPNDPAPNITSIHANLVSTLQAMNDHVRENQNDAGPVTFPVNLMPGGGDEFGVVSYPGFLKPCRALNYPNLAVWYQACEAAMLLCQHVYIYRDPYSVVRSTTDNRPFNKNKMEAIHLYTTQLHILHSQLIQFQDKAIGCWNYNAALSPIHYKEQIEPILQFREERKFAEALGKLYKRPKSSQDNKAIVPPELDGYMKSMEEIHELVVQTCKNLKRYV